MARQSELGVDDYVERIEPEIMHCVYDQPWEGGEAVWVFGSCISLESLLDQYGVPERLRDEVAKSLTCRGCGAQLDRWADVGVKYDFEVEHDRRIELAQEKYESRLFDFHEHLCEFPYLGASHPIGRRILREISEFPSMELAGGRWFRARGVRSGRSLTAADMLPPDPGQVRIGEGRYNHPGQSYWYLASSQEAAAAEAVAPREGIAWVQEFELQSNARVLDLRGWEADDERFLDDDGNPREVPLSAVALVFSDRLVEWVERGSLDTSAYHVPRFVADAARKAGFAGVIFRSPRHYDDNLVLFDRSLTLVPIGEPILVSLPEHLVRVQGTGLFFSRGYPLLDVEPIRREDSADEGP